MKQYWIPLILFLALLLSGVFAWHYLHTDTAQVEVVSDATPVFNTKAEPIIPIPLQINLDTKKVALGKQLFHEPRLSQNNAVPCAHCHKLELGGTDGMSISFGINGAKGAINSPTVFNSGFNFRQFWDGRAATLEEQINGPTHSPIEMASSWKEIIAKLNADPKYPRLFATLYTDGITAFNIRDAIATFERSLYTPNARFDRFLRGETDALSEQEHTGYTLFKNYGCVSCHQGVNVGGNMYQVFGVMGDYFADRGNITEVDYGRFNVTGRQEDKFVFKVPTLRNIALTAPYFHDASATTLKEAVKVMGRYQLGRILSAEEIEYIVAFLHTLTGEYQGTPL